MRKSYKQTRDKWKITVAAQGRMFLGVNYWNAKNKQNKQEAYPWSLFFKNTVFLSCIFWAACLCTIAGSDCCRIPTCMNINRGRVQERLLVTFSLNFKLVTRQGRRQKWVFLSLTQCFVCDLHCLVEVSSFEWVKSQVVAKRFFEWWNECRNCIHK